MPIDKSMPISHIQRTHISIWTYLHAYDHTILAFTPLRGCLLMTSPSWREPFENREPSPRIRLATLLYQTGTARTKAEAAKMAGISPATFYMTTIASNPTRRLAGEVQEMIANESVKTSEIIAKLSRRALGRMAELMDSDRDDVAFRAAQDLMDRDPGMPKITTQINSPFTISEHDAGVLARALVESANAYEANKHAAAGMVEVDLSAPQIKLLPPEVKPNGKSV